MLWSTQRYTRLSPYTAKCNWHCQSPYYKVHLSWSNSKKWQRYLWWHLLKVCTAFVRIISKFLFQPQIFIVRLLLMHQPILAIGWVQMTPVWTGMGHRMLVLCRGDNWPLWTHLQAVYSSANISWKHGECSFVCRGKVASNISHKTLGHEATKWHHNLCLAVLRAWSQLECRQLAMKFSYNCAFFLWAPCRISHHLCALNRPIVIAEWS